MMSTTPRSAPMSPRRTVPRTTPLLYGSRSTRPKRGACGVSCGSLRRSRQRGFVLLAVLWVMVGISALGLALALSARRAIRGAENRRAEEIATWVAEGCAERARAIVEGVLGGRAASVNVGGSSTRVSWRTLDRVLAESPLMMSNGCAVTLQAAGSTLDVNSASEELLHNLFTAMGESADRADSLTQALLDWRDPDDLPRPVGAERSWYEQEARSVPRNGPLASVRELARIRGFDATPGLDSMLGVEPGRVDLAHAPLQILAALPGFTSEAVARVGEERLRGVPVSGILALSGRLTPNAREALISRYAELARLTVTEPDAWILTSRASVGEPAIIEVVELRLVRAGTRAAVVRRRTRAE